MMRLLVVKGVIYHPKTNAAVLKLETATADLHLELAIPHDEANRLARLLGEEGCRCTSIYETLLVFTEQMAATLVQAVLHGSVEGVSASLVFDQRGATIEVAAHPADAVALALRTLAPIYADAGALAQAYPTGQHSILREQDDLAPWLEQLRPADFEQP
jgi:bifunctional DNase/RNase